MTAPSKRRFALKIFSYSAALLGLAASLWLALRSDAAGLLRLFEHAGWPLLLLVPLRALPLLLDALGWRALLADGDALQQRRASTLYLFWATTVREAVSRLLPLSSVGGELVGLRLGLLRGIEATALVASIVMQLLVSVINQFLFALLGLGLILLMPAGQSLAPQIAGGLAIAAPLPVLLWLLLRHGAWLTRLTGLLRRAVGAETLAGAGLQAAAVDAQIRASFGRPRQLLASGAWELSGLLLGCVENWIALHLLGQPISLAMALSLEAVTQAVRRVFFMMPAGLGVQEAGLMLLGPAIGVPAELAIALSLTKRAREVLFGIPALLSWQWLEISRLRSGFRPP